MDKEMELALIDREVKQLNDSFNLIYYGSIAVGILGVIVIVHSLMYRL